MDRQFWLMSAAMAAQGIVTGTPAAARNPAAVALAAFEIADALLEQAKLRDDKGDAGLVGRINRGPGGGR